MERVKAFIKGLYRDVLTNGDGRILYDSGWTTNTIVEGCRILLAGLVGNESSFGGIQYLAVGKGLDAWDKDGAGAAGPDATETDLVNSYNPPVKKLEFYYLDEHKNKVGEGCFTNRLEIKTELVPGYPEPLPHLNTYPLREFGLFGSFKGKGYMINNVRHPVIHKDASATLVRVIRLYF